MHLIMAERARRGVLIVRLVGYRIFSNQFGHLVLAIVLDFFPILFESIVFVEVWTVIVVVAFMAFVLGFVQWQSHLGPKPIHQDLVRFKLSKLRSSMLCPRSMAVLASITDHMGGRFKRLKACSIWQNTKWLPTSHMAS